MKLGQKVLIPVKQFPKFNFVGKLLGPRGNSLKRLQEDTLTKMSILGKGSMRDKEKEEELRKSGEAKYQHLNEDLHVLIEVFAPPAEAHNRMGHALEEIKKFLIPDYNDEIRQAQLQELTYLNGGSEDAKVPAVRGKLPAARGRGTSATGPIRLTLCCWSCVLGVAEVFPLHTRRYHAEQRREGCRPPEGGACQHPEHEEPPHRQATGPPHPSYRTHTENTVREGEETRRKDMRSVERRGTGRREGRAVHEAEREVARA
ncbi:hypothetical protein DPEC_G00283100 [Dallia pectoralis]|uniref:Uncharacterized protein n=1 Tax=Dallia pectoralis TaxID=75939 RepID=A0ACC2FJ23_DALPE|nr:hypothetical protein DPEC_G00283100 [Dallia pectoralis]